MKYNSFSEYSTTFSKEHKLPENTNKWFTFFSTILLIYVSKRSFKNRSEKFLLFILGDVLKQPFCKTVRYH